jgi:hypothetical protein
MSNTLSSSGFEVAKTGEVGRDGRSLSLYAGIAVASVVYFAGLLYYAQTRPIEADEGYYITAARLVWEGKVPYHDFSYQQAALLPYLYSWVWAVQPRSLVAMRYLSSALGASAVLLWGVSLVSLRRLPTKVALATFAAILLNPSWVSWNVLVKTFAVANFLISIAIIALYAALHAERRVWYVAAGLALGACASVRSLYAPLVPVVLLWLIRREWRVSKWRVSKAILFLGGAACGVLPMIVSLYFDRQAFLFNNLQYRNLLNPHVSFRHWAHSYLITALLLAQHAYFVLTLLLAIVGAVSLWKLGRWKHTLYSTYDYEFCQLTLLMLVVYVLTSSIPFPVYDQYFTSPLLPFLVPFIAEGLRRIIVQFKTAGLAVLGVLALVFFVPGLKIEIDTYSRSLSMRLSSYRSVAQVIETNSSPDEVVLSIWPGYVMESGRQYFAGSENHFNYMVGYKISPEMRMRFHVLSKEDVTNAISHGVPDLFVSGWNTYHLESTMTPDEVAAFHAALDANYSLVGRIDQVGVYRRR